MSEKVLYEGPLALTREQAFRLAFAHVAEDIVDARIARQRLVEVREHPERLITISKPAKRKPKQKIPKGQKRKKRKTGFSTARVKSSFR